MLFDNPVVVIDFETDMVKHVGHIPMPIEVGCVKIDLKKGAILDRFDSLITPRHGCDFLKDRTKDPSTGEPVDETLADILKEDLAHAPHFHTVAEDLSPFCEGCTMAAWPTKFEAVVLETSYRYCYDRVPSYRRLMPWVFNRRWIDIGTIVGTVVGMKLGKKLDSYSATACAKALKLPHRKLHRALPDAEDETLLLWAALRLGWPHHMNNPGDRPTGWGGAG